jgi:16S rRNA processing protein RimM
MSRADGSAELIELAAVVRSHGLRGELLLKPFNRESSLIEQLTHVYLKARDGAVQRYEIEQARVHGDGQLLALKEVRSREASDALRGSLVCVRREDLPLPDEGEHYLVDLVGLQARDAQGNVVGKVEEVIDYPTVVCFVVVAPEGKREVPNLPRYVLAIEPEAGTITVDNIAELELEKPVEARGTARDPNKAG